MSDLNTDNVTTNEAPLTDGRRVPVAQKRYRVNELYAMHHEILRRLAVGEKPASIAVDLGITTQTISNVRNTALARAKMVVLQETRDKQFAVATKRVTEMMPRALNLLDVLLRQGESIAGYDPATALKIVDKTLTFAEFTKPVVKGVNLHLHSHQGGYATAEDLAAVKASTQRAVSEGAVVEVVDAEYTEVDVAGVPATDEVSRELDALLKEEGFI